MTDAGRRKSARTAARALALAAAALALAALASWLLGLRRGRVDVRYRGVTERDVEIARQMGYPDDVVERMERGEWNLPSTRETTRVAELAQDHVREAYGIEAVPSPAWVPAFTHRGAVVRFAVSGGEHDGAAFAVQVDRWDAEPEFSDDLYAVWWSDEFDAACRAAADGALAAAGLPEGSWVCRTGFGGSRLEYSGDITKPLAESGTLGGGNLLLYVSPDPFDGADTVDEAKVDEVAAALEESLRSVGVVVEYDLVVLSEAPGDGAVTEEFLESLNGRGLYLGLGLESYEVYGFADPRGNGYGLL